MPTELMPFQVREKRASLILEIESIIEQRDASSFWPYVFKWEQIGRADYVAAMKLLKAGIDLDAPDIMKVTRVIS